MIKVFCRDMASLGKTAIRVSMALLVSVFFGAYLSGAFAIAKIVIGAGGFDPVVDGTLATIFVAGSIAGYAYSLYRRSAS